MTTDPSAPLTEEDFEPGNEARLHYKLLIERLPDSDCSDTPIAHITAKAHASELLDIIEARDTAIADLTLKLKDSEKWRGAMQTIAGAAVFSLTESPDEKDAHIARLQREKEIAVEVTETLRAQVTDLQAANTREVERRRTAEFECAKIANAAVDGLLIGKTFYPHRVTEPLAIKDTPFTKSEIEQFRQQFNSELLSRMLATIEQRDRLYAAIWTNADPAGTLREVVELRDLTSCLSEKLRIDRQEAGELQRRLAAVKAILVVATLRVDGHEVYDFKDADGFHWSEVDPEWHDWPGDIHKYLDGLDHPAALRGYNRDIAALIDADICVYVMPCGVSASLEAGWAKGAGKPLFVYVPALREPDLMIKIADLITQDLQKIVEAVRDRERCLYPANDESGRCGVERRSHGSETWIGSRHKFDFDEPSARRAGSTP